MRGRSTWHADEYGPDVAAQLHIGGDPAAAAEAGRASGWGEMVGGTTLEALAAFAGLSPAGVEARVTPIVAPADVHSHRLGRTIPQGAVNRIPDVLAAPPGLVTVDRLPLPRYRPGALRHPGRQR